MKIQIIIFLAVALTIIFSAHLAIYASCVHYLKIQSSQATLILKIVLAFLSVSFILSSVLSRYSSNILIKLYYTISVYWSGLIIYFLLTALLVFLLVLFGKMLNISFDTKTPYLILITLSFVFSVFGIVASLTPRVKDIEVAIKNLPEAWNNKTIVQVSDLHLGLIYNEWFGEKIIGMVNGLNPEMVVFTGDYLDGSCPHIDKLLAIINNLKSDYVYYISGNHETYIGMDEISKLLEDNKAKLLDDKIINVNGMNIVGMRYPRQGENINHQEILNKINPDEPNILLYHEPRFMKLAKDAGVNLQLSGHTHRGQFWPYNFFTRMIYGKYHYGLNTDGEYNIYTSSGTGTWGPPNRFLNSGEIVRITLVGE